MPDAGRVVTMQSSAKEKVRLFRAMICGREDVMADLGTVIDRIVRHISKRETE